jgi:hypothetical protein
MIVGLINQLPIAFEEGCRDQTTRLEGMVLTLCISNRNLIFLKSYICPLPYFQISVVGNSS